MILPDPSLWIPIFLMDLTVFRFRFNFKTPLRGQIAWQAQEIIMFYNVPITNVSFLKTSSKHFQEVLTKLSPHYVCTDKIISSLLLTIELSEQSYWILRVYYLIYSNFGFLCDKNILRLIRLNHTVSLDLIF